AMLDIGCLGTTINHSSREGRALLRSNPSARPAAEAWPGVSYQRGLPACVPAAMLWPQCDKPSVLGAQLRPRFHFTSRPAQSDICPDLLGEGWGEGSLRVEIAARQNFETIRPRHPPRFISPVPRSSRHRNSPSFCLRRAQSQQPIVTASPRHALAAVELT